MIMKILKIDFKCKKIFLVLYISKQSSDQTLNLLLITGKEKSRFVFIKDFSRLMFSSTKHKTKNITACLVYKVLLQKKYYLITKNSVY